ncbi:Pkinase-domain-containing protein [Exidia glandulosa HHB12029]|uniref:Pkinase-domain-containing protein n=1 Tax=Exidia glandulosa HHB12029 TaxID=1314781 RepID=A0A165R070_EXIGL|nr:Pkinase-domain-containing protein [Exidia glandulosa HHB12029]
MDSSSPPPSTQPLPPTQPLTGAAVAQVDVPDTALWGRLFDPRGSLPEIAFTRGKTTYTLGRHTICDVVFDAPTISKTRFPSSRIARSSQDTGARHCQIELRHEDGDGYEVVVTDLSTNGTIVRLTPSFACGLFFVSDLPTPLVGARAQMNGQPIGRNKSSLMYHGDELKLPIPPDMPRARQPLYVYTHFGPANTDGGAAGVNAFFKKYQLSIVSVFLFFLPDVFASALVAGPTPRVRLLAMARAANTTRRIGRGAFGCVRRAIAIDDGDSYAVKIIQHRRLAPNEPAMFARELQIMQTVNHPGIVRCFDIYRDAATIFLVMELVEGGDLLELISDSSAGLPELDARHLTHDIVSAMSYLHGMRIVHRDIKPENILVSAAGAPSLRRRAKIADFGLAKIVTAATFLRTVCGTPAYLAPEVVSGLPGLSGSGLVDGMGRYDELVDSWSVGAVVYAMLTKSLPFHNTTPRTTAHGRPDRSAAFQRATGSRTVDWAPLANRTLHATSFIRALLQVDPRERMAMAAAVQHAWLAET